MTSPAYKPGDIVADQYEIKGVVGSGGFARVYRAVERRLGRDVALKIMASSGDVDEDESGTVYGRFVREARLVSQLNNPHTITLYDYDSLSDGRLYMALEFVEGTTLEQTLEGQSRLSIERIRRIVTQMLDGLGEAHAAGVLHRDIKPSNVMLFDRHDRKDCVKLLDFGIAKKVASEDELHDDLTVFGTLVGTPRYMSPEQIQQLPLTPASDLYSVGLLIYEMWSGQSPFPSSDVTDIFKRMQAFEDDIEALTTAPDPLQAVGRRLLQPEPADRYETAEAVLEALGHTTDAPAPADGGDPDPVDGVPPTFPVGFDRAADSPSSELTGVDLAQGKLTAAAERQLEASAPASHSPPPPQPTPPDDVTSETTVEDRTPRGQRSTDTVLPAGTNPDDNESRTVLWIGIAIGLVGLIAAGLAVYVRSAASPTPDETPETAGVEPGPESGEASSLDAPESATTTDQDEPPVGPAVDRAAREVTDAATASAGRAEKRADETDDSEPSPTPDSRPSPGPTSDPPEDSSSSSSSSGGQREPDRSGSADDEPEGVPIQPFE